MMLIKRTVVVLIILISVQLGAQESMSRLTTSLAIDLGSLREASRPRLVGSSVVLTYAFPRDPAVVRRSVHAVQAAFAHERYSVLHTYQRNEQGVFLLVIPRPPGVQELQYRLVVDGLWVVDQFNPDMVTDRQGVAISRFVLPPVQTRIANSPVIHPDGSVEFIFRHTTGSRVTVAGDFNGWDPFMTPLEESAPGIYRASLRLTPGLHVYYYFVDGSRLPDPLNELRRHDTNGRIASVVTVP